jgi:hypothetical protein
MIILFAAKNKILKSTIFCGKYNRDYAAYLRNSGSFNVVKVHKMNL